MDLMELIKPMQRMELMEHMKLIAGSNAHQSESYRGARK